MVYYLEKTTLFVIALMSVSEPYIRENYVFDMTQLVTITCTFRVNYPNVLTLRLRCLCICIISPLILANMAFMALLAADDGLHSTSYRTWAKSQIHYALGDAGRSFVCGFGVNPPVQPHHRGAYVHTLIWTFLLFEIHVITCRVTLLFIICLLKHSRINLIF